MLNLRASLAASIAAVLLVGLFAACLPGCGGGDLTPEESAQHAADMQALEALQIDAGNRKTIQTPSCAASACK